MTGAARSWMAAFGKPANGCATSEASDKSTLCGLVRRAQFLGYSNANLLIAIEPEWTIISPVWYWMDQLQSHDAAKNEMWQAMRVPHRLPDFSVVVWIKMNENFPTLRSEVLAAAGAEPYEMTEYQGMADFHWGMTSIVDARKLAEALKVVSQRPEVVVLRIMSLVDDVASISIKDERVTKH